MISLGYAQKGTAAIALSRLTDGKQLINADHLSCVLVSRLDFDVRIVGLPRVSENEVEGLIRYRLRSIYPGNPADTAFDFRIESNRRQRSAVVFIARKSMLEEYRSAARRRPIVLPYSLSRRIVKIRKDVCICFFHHDWVEISLFRAGLLASSTVLRREEWTPETLLNAPQGVESAFPAVIICARDEIGHLMKGMDNPGKKRSGPTPTTKYLSFDDMESNLKAIDGLFQDRKPRRMLPARIRIAGLAAIVVILGCLVFFKRVRTAEEHAAHLLKMLPTLEAQSSRAIELQREIDSLGREIARIESEKPQDLYLFLSELADVLGTDIQIRTILVKEGSFQVEAVGSNPLKLMEAFRGRPAFSDVTLFQVVPDARSGKERFSFAGKFHAR